MTDRLREAAMKAVLALAHACEQSPGLYDDAYNALSAALAEPAPEPVAWRTTVQCRGPEYGMEHYGKLPVQSLQPGYYSHTPLYSAPPTRSPLTDDEVKQAVLNDPIYGAALMSMMRDGVTVAQLREAVSGIARAIERKIGGNDD